MDKRGRTMGKRCGSLSVSDCMFGVMHLADKRPGCECVMIKEQRAIKSRPSMFEAALWGDERLFCLLTRHAHIKRR